MLPGDERRVATALCTRGEHCLHQEVLRQDREVGAQAQAQGLGEQSDGHGLAVLEGRLRGVGSEDRGDGQEAQGPLKEPDKSSRTPPAHGTEALQGVICGLLRVADDHDVCDACGRAPHLRGLLGPHGGGTGRHGGPADSSCPPLGGPWRVSRSHRRKRGCGCCIDCCRNWCRPLPQHQQPGHAEQQDRGSQPCRRSRPAAATARLRRQQRRACFCRHRPQVPEA
mmetsp:Transcript_27457/g.84308  ORF Transcript_27457/g.84308 Transcript_27457/m.84308 type:complete len:225 (+) Transcript_27457:320-994(+)